MEDTQSARAKAVSVSVDVWWVFLLVGGAGWLLDVSGHGHVSWWVCAAIAFAPLLIVAAFLAGALVVAAGALAGGLLLDYRDKRRRLKRRLVLAAEVQEAIDAGTPIYRLSEEHQRVWRQTLAERKRLSERS